MTANSGSKMPSGKLTAAFNWGLVVIGYGSSNGQGLSNEKKLIECNFDH